MVPLAKISDLLIIIQYWPLLKIFLVSFIKINNMRNKYELSKFQSSLTIKVHGNVI